MKKFLTITSILIAILSMCICFTACQPQTVYYLPEIVADVDGLTIEHVNNIEKDYNLPVELPEQFTHEEFVNNESLSSAYLIKNSEGELIGWIIGGFGTQIKKGKVEYGVYADNSNGNGMQFNGGNSLRVYLPREDDLGFDNLKLTSNYGTVVYVDADACIDKNGEYTDYICVYYQIDLTGIDPKTVDKITITLSFEE